MWFTVQKQTLLILTFSAIHRDARVLKQINLFKDSFRVSTCGFGPAPPGVAEHIEIPSTESITYMDGRLITLRMYRQVYWRTPAIAWAKRALAGRDFDLAFANDFESVPLALYIKPRLGVHADLHEYSPSQFEHNEAWNRRIRPYREWVIRKYVSDANSWTTVCEGLSEKYNEVFGFRPNVVTNAAPFADLRPSPVAEPIRLVHHGAVGVVRGIDQMMYAVMASSANVSFDLYLNDASGNQLPVLRKIAEADPRVTVLDAVPYGELISLLNTYDVGLSMIQPSTFNLKYALPNKLFDYVQARVGVITGPSPEMATIVSNFSLGVVTEDFSEGALTAVVDSLKPQEIRSWKSNANRAARELSSETQDPNWIEPLLALGAARGI